MGFQCEATANNSLANGQGCKAGGAASHAEGYMSETKNQRSHADGYKAITDDDYAYAWNGITTVSAYHSNGVGTYSINPVGGLSGFYIGTQSLSSILSSYAIKQELPTKTSDLSNDSGFITANDISSKAEISSLSSKADLSSVPSFSIDGQVGDLEIQHVSI